MKKPARVLMADPAWLFGDKLPGKGRGAAKHYRCMTVPELREMLCNRVEDFTAKEIRIERCDTGEVVEARTMSPQELQGTLGFDAPGNGTKDEPEADPAPDSSLRTMADEQVGSDDDELGPIDLDDSFVEDDESEAQHLDA